LSLGAWNSLGTWRAVEHGLDAWSGPPPLLAMLPTRIEDRTQGMGPRWHVLRWAENKRGVLVGAMDPVLAEGRDAFAESRDTKASDAQLQM